MNAGTIRRARLLNGVKAVSTSDVPYVSWMSIHGRNLAAAAGYERECRICRKEVRQERIRALIRGEMVGLKTHTLKNGLVFATIHDKRGRPVFDALEYGGISARSDGNGRTIYMAVTRMARMASHACLGNGFELRYLDADPLRQSTYSAVRKEYAPGKGRMICLDYCIERSGKRIVQLLDFKCVVTGPERAERLIIGADGAVRASPVRIDGTSEQAVQKAIADIARAVAAGDDFTLREILG
jgi:hypothetical protein